MNILSYPIWPSDMPDERRVIALLGLVQISEGVMSEIPDKLLSALRQYQHNDCSGLLAGFDYDETIAVVSKQDAEIERLNALVAMQAEALEHVNGCPNLNGDENCLEKIDAALSATEETVSAWQSKRDVELAELQRENSELRKQLEAAEALLTMKTEALNAVISAQKGEVKDFALKAINATKETVSAWQLKRDAEIMARSLEGAADWYDYQDAIGNKAYKANRVQDDLMRMASELRAKGE